MLHFEKYNHLKLYLKFHPFYYNKGIYAGEILCLFFRDRIKLIVYASDELKKKADVCWH